MNPLDDQLNHLFRAARSPEAAPASAPYGLETRALAAWRAGRSASGWDLVLLGRGLAVAIVLMGLSFWPVLQSTSDPFSDYVQLADSSLPADVSP